VGTIDGQTILTKHETSIHVGWVTIGPDPGLLHLESPQHAGTSRLESSGVLFTRLRPCCRCASFCLGNILTPLYAKLLACAPRALAHARSTEPWKQPDLFVVPSLLLCTNARTDSSSEHPVLAGVKVILFSFFDCFLCYKRSSDPLP
jgi:hypothetical protein